MYPHLCPSSLCEPIESYVFVFGRNWGGIFPIPILGSVFPPIRSNSSWITWTSGGRAALGAATTGVGAVIGLVSSNVRVDVVQLYVA